MMVFFCFLIFFLFKKILLFYQSVFILSVTCPPRSSPHTYFVLYIALPSDHPFGLQLLVYGLFRTHRSDLLKYIIA